jgi:hypothetical protein
MPPIEGQAADGATMAVHEQTWTGCVVIDGARRHLSQLRFEPLVLGGDDPYLEGTLFPDPGVPVGRAVQIVLDDGRRSLAVIVSDRGRFLTVGLPD